MRTRYLPPILCLVLAACTPPERPDAPSDTDAAETDTERPEASFDTEAALDTDTTPPTDSETDADTAPEEGPARYPAGQVHSPITPFVAEQLAAIAARDASRQDDVFMKIGASSTVSRNTLHCFAGDDVNLGDHGHLQPTLTYFLGGDAGGSDPFDRTTLAARSGHSAGWAIGGDPSPIDQEIAAINPRYALVHYGTNDMGLGATYISALVSFHEHMMTLARELTDQGIIPVFTGISPRADRESADRWVHTYNNVIRGMAQGWQVPFVDLHHATWALDGHGLASDGLHLNRYAGGACILTDAGLDYGYNVRNLIVLEAFDRLRQTLADPSTAPDIAHTPLPGDGSLDEPWQIASLPFADTYTTAASVHRSLDTYTGCDSDADESGPEWIYTFTLTERTPVRAVVLDEGDVDIDVHLLSDPSEGGCLARGHHAVEATLDAGTYFLAVDTWVDGDGDPRSGEYLLSVVVCDAEDDCGEG